MNYIRDEQNWFETCLFVNVSLIEKKTKKYKKTIRDEQWQRINLPVFPMP